MKPFIEQVSRERNFNWLLRRFDCSSNNFEWHYHLEYEIVLLRHTSGSLFAGSYSGAYRHNTLAMFAPRLPHTSFIEDKDDANQPSALVLWFKHDWITDVIRALPEYAPISTLLSASTHGLTFSHEVAEQLSSRLEGFDSLDRSLQGHLFLEVLLTMAQSKPHKLNKVGQFDVNDDVKSRERVLKIGQFIETNYASQTNIEQLAQQLHTSKSSVQRLFKRHFNESFSEHLKQYRIGKACEQLINTERPVALISETCGYLNLSNFNRQFRQCMRRTPREFRQQFEVPNA